MPAIGLLGSQEILILVLLFVVLALPIIFLVVIFRALKRGRSQQIAQPRDQEDRPSPSATANRFNTLEDLRVNGTISDEEYQTKRQEILDEI